MPLAPLLDWAQDLGFLRRRLLAARPGPRERGHQGARALVMFDIDQSLLKWEEYNIRVNAAEFERLGALLRRHDEAGGLRIALNTGRSLHSVQHIARCFEPIPVDVLVTGDGQQIFWNPERQRADRWVARLDRGQEDRVWQRSHAGAWDERLALRVLWRSYRQHGFVPVSRRRFPWSHDVDHLLRLAPATAGDRGEIYAVGTGEGPAVKIRAAATDITAARELTRAVVHGAIEALDGLGIRALPDFRSWSPFWPAEEGHAYLVAGLKHPTVNKGSPVNWIIAEMERVGGTITGVVPVGDSGNDEGMIVPRWFAGRDGRTLPNLPVYHDSGNPGDKVLQGIQHLETAIIVSRLSAFGRRAQWAPDLPTALAGRLDQLAASAAAAAERRVRAAGG